MPESSTYKALDSLVLRSRLTDLALVFPWVDSLSAERAIPENLQYAINLCLEESLSNVIRHGRDQESDDPIVVRCREVAGGELFFTLEDTTPHFSPLDLPLKPEGDTPQSLDDLTPGGLGISLIRRFSDSLDYEPLPDGNRLTIGFSLSKG